jgi:8-oxo-dGTP pyrophosphatase MutT (NUDIX family)
MSGEHEKRRATGVYIVDQEKRRVLLVQRGPEARNEQGSWEGVGGEVGPKETFNQAALREARVKIGVHVVLLAVLSEHESVRDKDNEEWHAKRYLASMSGTPVIIDPGKVKAIDWFDAEGLELLESASHLRPDVPRLQLYLSQDRVTG